MKFVFFCHAISSCWNNGNAHFLRGVTRELARRGCTASMSKNIDGGRKEGSISKFEAPSRIRWAL